MSKSLSLITPEAANGIYADGIRKARQLREKAAATCSGEPESNRA